MIAEMLNILSTIRTTENVVLFLYIKYVSNII